MAMVYGKSTDKLLELYEGILSCRRYRELDKKVLAPMARYLEAETGCFIQFLHNGENGIRIGHSAHHHVHPDLHAQYTTHFFRLDPGADSGLLPSHQLTNVYFTSDICDYSKLMVGEFYNDFLRPTRIHHIMIMALRFDPISGERLVVGFQRPHSGSPFREEHKVRLASLSTVLSAALRSLSMQEALTVRNEALHELEDANPQTGIAFFDEHLSLLYSNPRALTDLHITESSEAGGARGSRLEAIGRSCRALASKGKGERALNLNFSTLDDLQAEVKMRTLPDGRPFFSVHTSTAGEEASFLERCAHYDITSREIDIIRLLRTGMSNAEIAARLFRSVRTIENHLRSIYSKTGVNRRTQLLSRLR